MTVRERILAIQLIEKIEKNAEYAKKIGITAYVVKEDETDPDISSDGKSIKHKG